MPSAKTIALEIASAHAILRAVEFLLFTPLPATYYDDFSRRDRFLALRGYGG